MAKAAKKKFSLAPDDLVRFIEDLGLILEVKYLRIPAICEILQTDFEENTEVFTMIGTLATCAEQDRYRNKNLGEICEEISCFPPFCLALLKLHDNADSARLGKVLRHYARILQRRIMKETRGKD